MENKITKYPIYAFEVDGNGRTGVVLVAAKDEKQAYQYIISLMVRNLLQVHHIHMFSLKILFHNQI